MKPFSRNISLKHFHRLKTDCNVIFWRLESWSCGEVELLNVSMMCFSNAKHKYILIKLSFALSLISFHILNIEGEKRTEKSIMSYTQLKIILGTRSFIEINLLFVCVIIQWAIDDSHHFYKLRQVIFNKRFKMHFQIINASIKK